LAFSPWLKVFIAFLYQLLVLIVLKNYAAKNYAAKNYDCPLARSADTGVAELNTKY
jgi:hypothetical protein